MCLLSDHKGPLDNYEYEFSVLSTRNAKNVGLQTLCARTVRKTRTGTRPRPPIFVFAFAYPL